jgi:hypothetical protein
MLCCTCYGVATLIPHSPSGRVTRRCPTRVQVGITITKTMQRVTSICIADVHTGLPKHSRETPSQYKIHGNGAVLDGRGLPHALVHGAPGPLQRGHHSVARTRRDPATNGPRPGLGPWPNACKLEKWRKAPPPPLAAAAGEAVPFAATELATKLATPPLFTPPRLVPAPGTPTERQRRAVE